MEPWKFRWTSPSLVSATSNAADKSYLETIKDIPFQYDLDNPVVEIKFQAELSKIVKNYDSLTISEEAEAVKILLGKINIANVYNWTPIFNEMATGCCNCTSSRTGAVSSFMIISA